MNTHAHHHHAPANHGRAFLIGIGLNSAFILVEVIYGFYAHSLALLADAGHNASDVLGLCMAWGATLLARRPSSARFTYGLQSASIYAAFANALLLIIVVAGLGWEALQRMAAPEAPAAGTVMVVAAIGVAINGFTAWLFHGDSHDLNRRGAFLHMAADALISLGVVLSALVFTYTGWLWLDPLVSLVIVVFIIASSWRLLKDSTSLALHAVPADIDADAVRAYLAQLPGVREVHDLHIWAMSTTHVALSTHLIMPGGHPGDAFIHDVTHALEERFHINHATIQIEIGGGHCHTGCDHE